MVIDEQLWDKTMDQVYQEFSYILDLPITDEQKQELMVDIADFKVGGQPGFHWDDETILYFRSKNKPGCEGDYIRAIKDFVKSDCTLEDGETYQELIEDLISKTRR